MYVNVAAVAQPAQIAADRAFGDVQRIADFPLWDYDLAVPIGKLIKDDIQELAGHGGVNLAA